ncbi:MAG: prenyltransferase [Deltaproteobacteria bacterium]|nr:prenyltransferase [Deltaproteobacteria bacterium]
MFRAFIQASRPLAQANIATPLVFGQAVAWAMTGAFDLYIAIFVHLIGVLDQLFIVYANDVADADADAVNEAPTLFSGGSRVLPEGKLSRNVLGAAAVVMGLGMIAGAFWATTAWHRPFAPVFIASGIFLLWGYSFGPLRLSYRGDGEVLQGLGVGVILPTFAYYMQTGSLDAMPMEVLGATFLLGYGGNVTTALPDYPADRKTNKRTVPVRLGELQARWVSLAVLATASFMALDTGPELPLTTAMMVASGPLVLLLLNIPGIGEANADNRRACMRFVILNAGAINALLIAWTVALLLRAGP